MLNLLFAKDDNPSKYIHCINLDLSIQNILDFENNQIQYQSIIDKIKTMKEINKDNRLTVYYDHSPCTICGFYFIVTLFLHENWEITAIQLLDNKKRWIDIDIDQIDNIDNQEKYERKLTNVNIHDIAAHWNKLKYENSNLKVVINGKLMSVEDDFYDKFILKVLSDETLTTAELVARTIYLCSGIYSEWLLDRIRVLIEHKIIFIQKYDNNIFKCQLRQTI